MLPAANCALFLTSSSSMNELDDQANWPTPDTNTNTKQTATSEMEHGTAMGFPGRRKVETRVFEALQQSSGLPSSSACLGLWIQL